MSSLRLVDFRMEIMMLVFVKIFDSAIGAQKSAALFLVLWMQLWMFFSFRVVFSTLKAARSASFY